MNVNMTFFGQMLSFVILIVFTMKFIWPPLNAALEERQKKIAEGLAAADRSQKDLAQAQEKANEALKDARVKANVDTQKVIDSVVGYITLGWCFSVEQGGRFVLLDELYLGPAARGRGWGRQALALARDWAAGQGAAVIRLEVNHHNAKAKSLYLSAGYRDDERDILTLSLDGHSGRLHS